MTRDQRNGARSERRESGQTGRGASSAESKAEEWGERASRWVLRLAARAKEEAEDIWAEAQTLRRQM